jgi:excisionase family DNA binding protein
MDTHNGSVPIAEAARRLGVSSEVVRKRIRRGTLKAYKDEGRWRVVLGHGMDGAGQPFQAGFQAGGQDGATQRVHTAGQHVHTGGMDGGTDKQAAVETYQAFVRSLEAEVDFLRAELIRKDHLLAGFVERLPALEASTAAPKRPWWKFWA